MRYLSFLDGKYSTAPGLVAMNKAGEDAACTFLMDADYDTYAENKKACRSEGIRKYFCEEPIPLALATTINRYLVDRLTTEYPQHFTLHRQQENHLLENKRNGETLQWGGDWLTAAGNVYLSLFDALCCCVQEDVAICRIGEENDRLAALHICAPNYWSPAEKIGKPFHTVHATVPGMEKTLAHTAKMLHAVVHKGPFERYAWGIASDNRLNHHPDPPPGMDAAVWQGRKITNPGDVFVRVEKQHIIGMPAMNAFLFTIRTFFYDVDTLEKGEKTALLQAVESMSAASLAYKGLSCQVGALRERLC